MKMRLFVVSVLLVFSCPFITTEVVDSFQKCGEFFLDEKPPVVPGILDNSVSQDNNRYKLICQRYENAYRFATLYDTRSRIPVFSAYKYTGHHKGRPNISWMIEPQLESLDAFMRVPCVNQAHTGDYSNTTVLNRGHLFPSSHAADKETANSTFTLTNIVPQYKTFNGGSWMRMEQRVRGSMHSHCREKDKTSNVLAYVLTGAVPSPDDFLKRRVNIPSFMWTVLCCYNHTENKWESQAHWAKNQDDLTNKAIINPITLRELTDLLQDNFVSGVVLFHDKCKNLFKM